MEEGILTTETEIADFVINSAYPDDVYPISCILTGSRAYGLDVGGSDWDFAGLHVMTTLNCLRHPNLRDKVQVIHKQYNAKLDSMFPGEPGGYVSLDSFEAWKFMSMLQKGSPVVYEILYMPEIHHDTSAGGIMVLMREALTNRIGKAAKGIVYHSWRKRKRSRKRTIHAYYRLLQAIHFLREEEFEWDAEALWQYASPHGLVTMGKKIFESYKDVEVRPTPVEEGLVEKISDEIGRLTEEVDRAMVVTTLPDESPPEVIKKIDSVLVQCRSRLI